MHAYAGNHLFWHTHDFAGSHECLHIVCLYIISMLKGIKISIDHSLDLAIAVCCVIFYRNIASQAVSPGKISLLYCLLSRIYRREHLTTYPYRISLSQQLVSFLVSSNERIVHVFIERPGWKVWDKHNNYRVLIASIVIAAVIDTVSCELVCDLYILTNLL